MPLYEYNCQACGHEFEELQKFSDKPIRKCPQCGKLKAEKKVSLSGFQLKGGGWYKDGYSNPSEGKKKNASTENTSKKETTTKTESKKVKG
mgnify:CR=1 FL=1|jgi:putative FmdB family regulatory protein